jgi:hypothetical protein
MPAHIDASAGSNIAQCLKLGMAQFLFSPNLFHASIKHTGNFYFLPFID